MLASGLRVENFPCLSESKLGGLRGHWRDRRERERETGSCAFLPLSVCRQGGGDGRNRQRMGKCRFCCWTSLFSFDAFVHTHTHTQKCLGKIHARDVMI